MKTRTPMMSRLAVIRRMPPGMRGIALRAILQDMRRAKNRPLTPVDVLQEKK